MAGKQEQDLVSDVRTLAQQIINRLDRELEVVSPTLTEPDEREHRGR